MPTLLGVGQRTHPVLLGRQREVGPRGHQHADGVHVAVGPVAEDDRLVQGGPPEPVDVVDVHSGPHQTTTDGRVASVGRPDQAGAVVGVERADVSAGRQGHLEQLQVALAGRDQVRALFGGVLDVDVRAGRDQPPRPVDVVGPRRVPQLAVEPACGLARRRPGQVRARRRRRRAPDEHDHDEERETTHPSSVAGGGTGPVTQAQRSETGG